MKYINASAFLAAAFCLSPAFAEPSGDRPDDSHAWAVHDVNRPDPLKIEAKSGKPPADAIILFDGTEQSIRENWRSADGSESKWKVREREFVCAPGSGSAYTKSDFSDCQLHIEWKTPVDDVEGWGNSGVIFLGQYEIQILDSSNVKPSRSPWKSANYADGQAGAVYGQNPPIVQPCREPGQWQTFDIVFHPPIWEGERLVDPGSATVFFNGVLVQDSFPFQGRTRWCKRAKTHADRRSGPVVLQDHGHPVPFRNIWIRKIPSRFADTVNGGPGLKYADVAKLRSRLAAESLELANGTDDPAEKYIRLWESFCYQPDRKVSRQIETVEKICIEQIENAQGSFIEARKFHAFSRFVDMLVRGNWITPEREINVLLKKMKKPPKPAEPNMRDF